jgi:hypothetical protein
MTVQGEPIQQTQQNSNTTSSSLECLEQGIQYHNEKSALWKEMNSIAKLCSQQTGIDRNTLMRVKDYLHYRGRGWGEDCLSKSEESEKFPDRVSPTFRHLVDIITYSYATGKEDLLDVYLEAIKEKGITVSIDITKFTRPAPETKIAVAEALAQMDPLQTIICEKNDYLTDVLAEEAESYNLSPKNKYKQIVRLAASKQRGRDIDDKVQDEYVNMELFSNGLEAANNIEQDDRSGQ